MRELGGGGCVRVPAELSALQHQRPGHDFEVGRGETSPGVQGKPYPKLKTPRISPTVFLGRPKFTCKKMNDIDSSKLEGRRPAGPKVGGASAPAAPRFPGLCTARLPRAAGPDRVSECVEGAVSACRQSAARATPAGRTVTPPRLVTAVPRHPSRHRPPRPRPSASGYTAARGVLRRRASGYRATH